MISDVAERLLQGWFNFDFSVEKHRGIDNYVFIVDCYEIYPGG